MACTLSALLPLLSLQLPNARAMIYLEDIEGALRHDGLPPPPQDALGEWFPPEDYPEGVAYPFRLGTPKHYLTHPPSPATSPMGLPAYPMGNASSVMDANATTDGNGAISEEGEVNNATTPNPTPNDAPDDPTDSSLFDRRRRQSALEGLVEGAMQRPLKEGHASPAGRQPTPFPTSVIPEITGEATDPFHPYKPYPSQSSDKDPLYFDDLGLITHPTHEYVYYDSKQARFGVDLGPRGNAEFVNMMLPPRWDTGGGDAWWEALDAAWWTEVDENGGQTGEEKVDVVNGNATVDDAAGNATSSAEGELEQSAVIQAEPAIGSPSSLPSTMPSLASNVETDRIRRLESIDELLGLEHFGGEGDDPGSTSNQTADVGNESAIIISVQPNAESPGVFGGSAEPPSIQYHVSDYFCLDDFLDWRVHQNNRSNTESGDSDAPSIMPNATRPNAPERDIPGGDSEILGVQSARPLTILVRRGRCSFESKARLAMMLNDLAELEGLANRISHIVVYNNGTASLNADESTTSDEQEKLVDMTRESTLNEGGEIKVGLLYIATQSGEDLLSRMRAREEMTGTNARVDVSILFQKEDASADEQTTTNGQSSRARERIRHVRRLTHGDVDGSTKDDGDYQDAMLDLNEDAVYDTRIASGWFFPVTMTRFCLSCGRGMHYGLVWPDDGSKGPNNSDGGFVSPPYGGTPGEGVGVPPLRPPIEWPTRYGSTDYHQRPYLEVIRKMMIAILVLLLVGPMLLAARRWRTVGGTFRITTDEHGRRRVRILNPNLEVFVNGVPGTVEENGTKLDRAQVFSLPEIEYMGVSAVDTEEDEHNEDEEINASAIDESAGADNSLDCDREDINEQDGGNLQMNCSYSTESSSPPGVTSMLSRESTVSARFVSSSTCSICLDEFVLGEKVRVLPRCDHCFHTDCILPWLTERQGCCPYCKVPVLPEEMQRSRTRHRLRRQRQSGLLRNHPHSTEIATLNEMEREEIAEGIQLASDVENDLGPAPQSRMSDVISDVPAVPFGAAGTLGDAGSLIEQQQRPATSVLDEEPRTRTVSIDAEDVLVAADHMSQPQAGAPSPPQCDSESRGLR